MALSDYTQLEYIYNNDGWAYIDTGYTMEKTDSITFEQICYISDITWSGVNGYCQWSSEILTLNSSIVRFHSDDINNMKKMALDLIDDKHNEEGEMYE